MLFCEKIQAAGFIGSQHISVPENNPLYRFALFSRHKLAGNFWEKILRIDEAGQRGFDFQV